MKYQDIQLISD